MPNFSLQHLDDDALSRRLHTLVSRDRAITASLLAHIAEFDARKLYVPAGYSSMFVYCVEHLKLADDAAYLRIHVARTTRAFPMLLDALEAGRLHLTAINLLAPHFTRENVGDLIKEATHLRKFEIEKLIANRFPQPEPLRLDEGIAALAPTRQLGLDRVEASADKELAAEPVTLRTKVTPIGPQRFGLQVTISGATHDKLRRAQDLLGHAVPDRDVATVLDRALDALITKLEKRKFGLRTVP